MAILLAAMGGNDPWAFFDIPNGDATQAFFSFPVISGGRYPNHGTEPIDQPGLSLIKDTRRLYRRHDGHCCPTGGRLIRIIGFKDGSYQVLDQFKRGGCTSLSFALA